MSGACPLGAVDGVLRGQDAERKRIAQELHDDIGQRLALLIMELDDVEQQSGIAGIPDVEQKLRGLRTTIESIASDLHRISHNLHPAALLHVGLVRALRRLCQDFTDCRHIHVEFTSNVAASVASQDVALSLYRVAQECLTNVARHSGSARARVALTEQAAGLNLTVADDGTGFDSDKIRSGGLGLITMRERVRGIGGAVEITSTPGHGVTVSVQVPMARSAAPGGPRQRPAARSRRTKGCDTTSRSTSASLSLR